VKETRETWYRGDERQLRKRRHCLATRETPDSVGARCPPCIRGQVASTWQHDQLVLRSSLPDCFSKKDISNISDLLLADHLCQGRAIFPYPRSEDDTFLVECLTLLRNIVAPYPLTLDYIVVRQVASEDVPLSVMSVALARVRDCLIGNVVRV
jgi:hypothetical protein